MGTARKEAGPLSQAREIPHPIPGKTTVNEAVEIFSPTIMGQH